MGVLRAPHHRSSWCWLVVLIMAAASTSSVASISLDRALLQTKNLSDTVLIEARRASKGRPVPQLRAAARGGGPGGASAAARAPLQQPSNRAVHTIAVTRDPAVLSRLPDLPDVASMSFSKVRMGAAATMAANGSRQAGASPQQAVARVGNSTAHTTRSGSTVSRRAATDRGLPGAAVTPILRQGPLSRQRPLAANATAAAASETGAVAAATAAAAAAAAQAAAVFSGNRDALLSGQCLETSTAQTSCLQSPNIPGDAGVFTMCLLPDASLAMYYVASGESSKEWAVPSPRAANNSQVVRLCLSYGGRLAVSQGDGTELYVVYAGVGASSASSGSQPFATYIEVNGNFAVYGSTCLKVAETGAWFGGDPPAPPCLARPPDVDIPAQGDLVWSEACQTVGESLPPAHRCYNTTTQPFNLACPGTYIQIGGQLQDNFVAGLGPIVCSDGNTPPDVVSAPASESSQSWTNTSSTGYNRISIMSAASFGIISITLGGSTTYGPPMSDLPDRATAELACPPGQKVVALHGTHLPATIFIFTLGVCCSAVCTSPVCSSSSGLATCTSSGVTPAGTTCNGECEDGSATAATCTALGSWKINNPCPSVFDTLVPEVGGPPRSSIFSSFNFSCPPGSHVVEFNGRHRPSEWVAIIGPFVCNDDARTSSDAYGPLVETPWQHTAPSGYSTITLWWTSWEGFWGIRLDPTSLYGNTYGTLVELVCPAGQRMSGGYGVYHPNDPWPMSIGIVCRPVCTSPVTDVPSLAACTNGTHAAGKRCEGSCAQGFGTLTATCDGATRTWVVTGSCQLGCQGDVLPPSPTLSYGWQGCGPARYGDICYANCMYAPGPHGQPRVMCQVDGSFSNVTGSCAPEEVTVSAPNNKTWIIRLVEGNTALQAREACRARGGDLLSINSAEEQQAFVTAYNQTYGDWPAAMWLGLTVSGGVTNKSDPTNWRWSSSGLQATYANWNTNYGEPKDWSQECQDDDPNDLCPSPGAPLCALAWLVLPYPKWASRWYSVPCNLTLDGYACQIGCSGFQLPSPATNSSWPAGLCDGAAPGSACTAACSPGAVPGPHGPPTAMCNNGTAGQNAWGNVTGSCRVTCNSSLPAAPANSTGFPSSCVGAVSGSVCVANCSRGFTGTWNTRCGSDGSWAPPTGGCTPGCPADALPPIPALSNGWLSRCLPAQHGSVCEARCLHAPGLQGRPRVTCLADGTFSNVTGACAPEEVIVSAPNNKTWIMRPFEGNTALQAREACRARGGDLLSINSAEEQQAFVTAYNQAYGDWPAVMWLGLTVSGGVTNKSDPTKWRWSSSGLQATYANWNADYGEPKDWSQLCQTQQVGALCPSPSDPLCAVVASDALNSSQWSTLPCNATSDGYACHLGCSGAQLPPAVANSSWPAGLCDGATPGSACTASCSPGAVPGPDGPPTAMCNNRTVGQHAWGNLTGSCLVSAAVTCNSSLPAAPANSTGFPGSCLGAVSGRLCVANCSSGFTGTWNTTCGSDGSWALPSGGCTPVPSCHALPPSPDSSNGWDCVSAQLGSVCFAECMYHSGPQGTPRVTCQADGSFSNVTGSCVPEELRVSAPNNKTWTIHPFGRFTALQAREACRARGGDLLSINSAEEQQAFVAAFTQTYGALTLPMWLGLFAAGDVADKADPANWRWMSSGLPAMYANWNRADWQPYDLSQDYQSIQAGDAAPSPGAPQCAVIWSGPPESARAFKWQTAACDASDTDGYACQIGCSGGQLPSATNSSWPAGLCDGATPGSACTASCSPGAVPGPDGPPKADCNKASTGQNAWSNTTGSCRVTCNSSLPAAPANSTGFPSSCMGAVGGSACVANCSRGFTGSWNTTCGSDGSWGSPTGGCTPGVCSGTPPVFLEGGSLAKCANTLTGRSCTGTCNPGRAGTPTVQCNPDPASSTPRGKWATTITGSCLRVCPGLPPQDLSPGGYWPDSCNNATTYLGLCSGVCNVTDGYAGSPTVQCLNGGWSSTVVGACRKDVAVCGALPPVVVANGRWPQSCIDTPDNETCTAVCTAPRFAGAPSPQLSCKGGQWDLSTLSGACRRLCTAAPQTPLPGGVFPSNCSGRVTAGGVCRGVCDAGMHGSPTLRCNNNGVWATTVIGGCYVIPVCKSPPSASIRFGSWSDTCYDVEAGKTCLGSCSSGYSTTEPPVATCVLYPNGTTGWEVQSSSTLTCRKMCTSLPDPSLINGTWPEACRNRLTLQQCTGNCTSGYGSPTVRCTSNGWTTTVVGRCSDTPVCTGRPQASVANAVWPNACSDASPGYTCEASCDAGYGNTTDGQLPQVTCVATGGTVAWSTTVTGTGCQRVCTTNPNAALLPAGGSWDCANKTPLLGYCTGSCGLNYAGSPQAQCLDTWEWAANLVSGTSCTPVP